MSKKIGTRDMEQLVIRLRFGRVTLVIRTPFFREV